MRVGGRVVVLGVGQDTVPVCPGVSQELGYLYRSSWPLLGVTQTRHDGQMETCFEDGLMGGWGWGTLPASIPRLPVTPLPRGCSSRANPTRGGS